MIRIAQNHVNEYEAFKVNISMSVSSLNTKPAMKATQFFIIMRKGRITTKEESIFSVKTKVNIDKAIIELTESILTKIVDVQETKLTLSPLSSNQSRCFTNFLKFWI